MYLFFDVIESSLYNTAFLCVNTKDIGISWLPLPNIIHGSVSAIVLNSSISVSGTNVSNDSSRESDVVVVNFLTF